VEDFVDTPAGPVPRVRTALTNTDTLGTLRVRVGIGRNRYRVAPGLYGVGRPDPESPVLVTANYKLSFDALRSRLAADNAWILVLDTRGINVWCAAGKGTFGTEEVIRRVQSSGLDKVVRHRRLILPQLAATGVAAHGVKKGCGFEVVWGPVKSRDVPLFLRSGLKADSAMRRVTFTLTERLVLVPVELSFLPKPLLGVLLAIFLVSGIGGDVFSIQAAWNRGWMLAAACLAGVFAGAVAAPALLPWLPFRMFSAKGALTGAAAGLIVAGWFLQRVGLGEAPALVLLATAVSSYLAMNFTGSTPYTSPSGVEKEMRRSIPWQAALVLLTAAVWIAGGFSG
jgi:hypothetical protein